LVLALTDYMRAELVRGGLDPARIEVLPVGIENADLLGLPPAESSGERPLRFGYFGVLAKHKGVHVLVEAFRRATMHAQLRSAGSPTDRPYVEHARQRALAAGAEWHGAYERAELPRLLSETDVVVVPSTWVENQPLVVREAFSARRPVIASR